MLGSSTGSKKNMWFYVRENLSQPENLASCDDRLAGHETNMYTTLVSKSPGILDCV